MISVARNKQAHQIKQEKDASKLTERGALRIVSQYGINQEEYDQIRKGLTTAFKCEPSPNDVVWSLFQKLIIKFSQQNDFSELSQLYYGMAIFLNEEGKDSFQSAKESRKCELYSYKKIGLMKNVEILCAFDCCESCKNLSGKLFSINEALEKMPIPVKKCSRPLNNNKLGFCRCIFIPKID